MVEKWHLNLRHKHKILLEELLTTHISAIKEEFSPSVLIGQQMEIPNMKK